jgi:hypothetical protein
MEDRCGDGGHIFRQVIASEFIIPEDKQLAAVELKAFTSRLLSSPSLPSDLNSFHAVDHATSPQHGERPGNRLRQGHQGKQVSLLRDARGQRDRGASQIELIVHS